MPHVLIFWLSGGFVYIWEPKCSNSWRSVQLRLDDRPANCLVKSSEAFVIANVILPYGETDWVGFHMSLKSCRLLCLSAVFLRDTDTYCLRDLRSSFEKSRLQEWLRPILPKSEWGRLGCQTKASLEVRSTCSPRRCSLWLIILPSNSLFTV